MHPLSVTPHDENVDHAYLSCISRCIQESVREMKRMGLV